MSTPQAQTYANHRRTPPLFYAAGIVLLGELCRALWSAVREFSLVALWAVLVAAALLYVWYFARRNAQVVQDRVIRLEMRVRLARVLGADRRADVERLELRQLVALRFASDAELPALVDDVLAGRVTRPDDVKRRVRDWQPDTLRV